MSKPKINILSTAPLWDDAIEKAHNLGVNVTVTPFIKIIPTAGIALHEEIQSLYEQPINIVFTSSNAIRAIGRFEGKCSWNIYCIGHGTRKLVKEYYGEANIAGIADSAAELAVLMLRSNVTKVMFFCGSKRRDELVEILETDDVAVREIVVYDTVEQPQKVSSDFDAIMFCSPSAARAYFADNRPAADTILFAIGNTTATEIGKYSKNKIIVSSAPTKKLLMYEVLKYFQAQMAW